MFYDFLLLCGIYLVLGMINLAVFLIIYDHETLRETLQFGETLGNPFFYAALFCSTITFYIYFWTHSGSTPGMKAWRLRILNEDKRSITTKQALVRFFIAIPAIGLFGIGFFWCYFNLQRKSLQDILTNSKTYYYPNHRSY